MTVQFFFILNILLQRNKPSVTAALLIDDMI